jgi:hypothetical protein
MLSLLTSAFASTTAKIETFFGFRGVADVVNVKTSDLSGGNQDTISHTRTAKIVAQEMESEYPEGLLSASASSALGHCKRNAVSAILNRTVTMASNIARNPGVHQDLQKIGNSLVAVIGRLQVSGSSSSISL